MTSNHRIASHNFLIPYNAYYSKNFLFFADCFANVKVFEEFLNMNTMKVYKSWYVTVNSFVERGKDVKQ